MTINKLLYLLEKYVDLTEGSTLYSDFDFLENTFFPSMAAIPQLQMNYGATKVVLSYAGFDSVIKLPLYDNENEPYSGAKNGKNSWDYCLAEAEIYAAAEEQGLGECFAKVLPCGYLYGIPAYSQEKCHPYFDEAYEDAVDLNKRDKIFFTSHPSIAQHKCLGLPVIWMESFIDYYCEEMLEELIKFCNDNFINDLTGWNIGYCGDRPVLFDYSGFRG